MGNDNRLPISDFLHDLKGVLIQAVGSDYADRIIENMADSLKTRIRSAGERVNLLKQLIDASDPKSVLARGYSVVTDEKGHIISRADDMKVGQNVNIETGSGSALAEIRRID
jgi:exodeoxyribonuclease VII large subunit